MEQSIREALFYVSTSKSPHIENRPELPYNVNGVVLLKGYWEEDKVLNTKLAHINLCYFYL